jgi:hypothetical protein
MGLIHHTRLGVSGDDTTNENVAGLHARPGLGTRLTVIDRLHAAFVLSLFPLN